MMGRQNLHPIEKGRVVIYVILVLLFVVGIAALMAIRRRGA